MHHSFLQQRSRFESKVFQQNEKNVFWYIYAMIEYIPIKVKKKMTEARHTTDVSQKY